MRAEIQETGGTYLDLKAVRLRYLGTPLPGIVFWIPKETEPELIQDLFNDALVHKEEPAYKTISPNGYNLRAGGGGGQRTALANRKARALVETPDVL